MHIVSYNVNGIRAAIKKGLLKWLKETNPDIFCIQESKSQVDQVDASLFEDLGYHAYWHSAEKKGYSGVITFSKVAPTKVIEGMGNKVYDVEGRVLETQFKEFTLLNCYFPSGSSGEARHDFKMEFLHDFKKYIDKRLKKGEKLIILGDYNVVRLDIDIHNPTRRDKPSGFKPEERAWLNEWFDTSFVDTYRKFDPASNDVFSWWSYRAGSKAKNKGWRIDYISCTKNLEDKLKSAHHHTEITFSDHCPIDVKLRF